MKVKGYKRFVKEIMKADEFEGCRWVWLNDKYALVFAYNMLGELDCKIAYNVDDLQCDYDVDWYMDSVNGEVIDTEILDCKSYSYQAVIDGIEYGLALLRESKKHGRATSGREVLGLENLD